MIPNAHMIRNATIMHDCCVGFGDISLGEEIPTTLPFFLGPHLWHMEVLRLGVQLELQLPAYVTATAMQDLSRVCNLHHSSQQCQIQTPTTLNKQTNHTPYDIQIVYVFPNAFFSCSRAP